MIFLQSGLLCGSYEGCTTSKSKYGGAPFKIYLLGESLMMWEMCQT